MESLIRQSDALAARYPGLTVGVWSGRVVCCTKELPPLGQASSHREVSWRRATNMTAFFRELGAKGSSPVEFQIRKAREGTLQYSHHNRLVDYLLYAEICSGFLIGLHDRDTLQHELIYGLASEADQPTLAHISGKTLTLRPDEPVLMANGRIFASLRYGPDHATRICDTTVNFWGVLFGSLQDEPADVDSAIAAIWAEGIAREVWTHDAA